MQPPSSEQPFSFVIPPPSHIHLWLIPIDTTQVNAATFECYLADDEVRRSKCYRKNDDRRRFVMTRLALRQLIAGYLKTPPQSCEFGQGPHGKPDLTQPADSRIDFNVSHSGEFGLIAITSGCCVGVDIEEIRPEIEIDEIANTSFSATEKLFLDGIPLSHRRTVFYEVWTRKEAYLKCLGIGLSDASQQCTATGPLSGLVSVRSLPVVTGYAAAVASIGEIAHVALRKFLPRAQP